MRRRKFISLVVGAATCPLAAPAQQAEQVRLIGLLMNLSESDPESQARIGALRDGLRKLGWIDGRNIQIESRLQPAIPNALALTRPNSWSEAGSHFRRYDNAIGGIAARNPNDTNRVFPS